MDDTERAYRYTVDRATENSSAGSALVCSPGSRSATRCCSRPGLSLGFLPRSRPFARATFMPARVLIRVRSDSATMVSTLHNNRPTRSVGSCTAPPRLSFTCRPVSSSTMSRASGSDRAGRSSYAPAAGRPRLTGTGGGG